jgi:hypothetical protein
MRNCTKFLISTDHRVFPPDAIQNPSCGAFQLRRQRIHVRVLQKLFRNQGNAVSQWMDVQRLEKRTIHRWNVAALKLKCHADPTPRIGDWNELSSDYDRVPAEQGTGGTSALSHNDLRVDGLQFGSRVVNFELPVDAALSGVAVSVPSGGFRSQNVDRRETSVLHALTRHRT